MKKTCFIFTLCVLASWQAVAQIEFDLNYCYSRPSGQMANNIKGVHGLNLGIGYKISKTPIAIGLDIGLGGYGYQTQRQTYTFANGSTTTTNVNVSNNMTNLMLKTRIYYPTKAWVQPYIQLRGGLSYFYTNLTIEDPQDVDDCHPLESTILRSSYNLAGSAGIGARIRVGERFAIDISSNYVAGGRVSYMSLNKATTTATPTGDVSAEFINTTNQVVHKHHVGYVYETPIRLFDWRIGMSMNF